MNMDDKEKCLRCDRPGRYWDFSDGILVSLCEKHVSVLSEASS